MSTMKRTRVLLDCDGILADFCSACFDLIEHHTGDRHTHEEVTHWDLFTILGKPHLKKAMKERAGSGGWCSEFLTYAGAQDAVKELEKTCEIVIVTSPMSVPNWAYERELWLTKHFGIPKGRIVQTEGKQYVAGNILIDDADENCIKWADEYPNSVSLLWDAPYNRSVDLGNRSNLFRVSSWEEVKEHVRLLEAKKAA